jgi:hypothetical protein
MQHGEQPFWARLQLLLRPTLNTWNYAADKPARLAQLDDGNDRAILVQGDEGSAQSLPRRRPGSFGWGIAALRRLNAATKLPFLAARPIASIGPSICSESELAAISLSKVTDTHYRSLYIFRKRTGGDIVKQGHRYALGRCDWR